MDDRGAFEMPDCAPAEERMAAILGLERRPVAVWFVGQGDALPEGFDAQQGRRYCQVLMEAGSSTVLWLAQRGCAINRREEEARWHSNTGRKGW